MNEFERIERLKTLFQREDEAVLVGIGDDAALLGAIDEPIVWTVDACVEGVHFERAFASWEAIAGRAFVAGLSDVFAMGASPVAALCALTLTGDDAAFDGIAAGLARTSDRAAVPIVGGNITGGAFVSITTTVIGRSAVPVLRSGAKPGDSLYVTGTVGGAGLGLAALRQGAGDDPRVAPFVERWRDPPIRSAEGTKLGSLASAAIDISDGFAQDLAHVTHASGVGAEVELEKIPMPPGLAEGCAALGLEVDRVVLGGGDDYELLFTSKHDIDGDWATRVGRITDTPGIVWLDSEGNAVARDITGYVHNV